MSDGLIPNSFTLHSGAEEQRAGEKEETKQETEKEHKRVRQLVSQQRNSQNIGTAHLVYTKATRGVL